MKRWVGIQTLFTHDLTTTIGGAVVALLVVLAILAPMIAPYDPAAQDLLAALQGPTVNHPMGTDAFGRDLLSRMLFGARLSLLIGFVSAGIAVAIGVPLGLTAAQSGGLVDSVIMRVTDMLLAFPGLLLVVVVIAILGSGIFNAMIAIGIASAPLFVRVTRSSTASVVQEDYVHAAKSLGSSSVGVAIRHILPNILSPIIVIATLRVATSILAGATLGYLGLGAQPPTAEWGLMLSEASAYIGQGWWLAFFPGAAILMAVLGMNLVGDGLRDALDPKFASKNATWEE